MCSSRRASFLLIFSLRVLFGFHMVLDCINSHIVNAMVTEFAEEDAVIGVQILRKLFNSLFRSHSQHWSRGLPLLAGGGPSAIVSLVSASFRLSSYYEKGSTANFPFEHARVVVVTPRKTRMRVQL